MRPNSETYFREALRQFGDDIQALANFQSALPSENGIATLPGATALTKSRYLVAYIDRGRELGYSAFDMIAHDTLLRKARPKIHGKLITDPRRAAEIRCAEMPGGTLERVIDNLKRDDIETMDEFKAAPVYAGFWSRYGLGT